MTYTIVSAYAGIAALLLLVSLVSTSQPRSLPLIILAAALWPLTLAAIVAHACLIKPAQFPGAPAAMAGAHPTAPTTRLPASG